MKKSKCISVTSYTIEYGWPESRSHKVPGYVLANGLVLLESERDEHGNYKAGAGMDGMYMQTGRLFKPVYDENKRIIAFDEI